MRTFTTLILVAALAAGLSACGRKGQPIPPDGATVRQYPQIPFPQSQTPAQREDRGTETIPQ